MFENDFTFYFPLTKLRRRLRRLSNYFIFLLDSNHMLCYINITNKERYSKFSLESAGIVALNHQVFYGNVFVKKDEQQNTVP